MTRYLIAEARPSHILPPWSSNNSDNTTFTHVQQLDEQPFAYKENLVYVLTSDIFLETEVLEALVERKYISEDKLRSSERSVGEIHTMEKAKGRMLGIFIKPHVDSKPLRPDLRQCVKTLRQIIIKFKVHSIGIIRDLGILSVNELSLFIENATKFDVDKNCTTVIVELRCGIDLTEAQGRNQNARFLKISQHFVGMVRQTFQAR